MADFLGAIDQGTTSTRFMIFDHSGQVVASDQREFRQILPRAGWVEHDPNEIWETVAAVIATALDRAGLVGSDLAAVGLTNQRETAVVWDRRTGEPISNAIVWQDTRTDALCRELAGDIGPDRYADRVGLPLATYFSGPKVRWILDHVDGARARAERGDLAFGTVDSWLIHRMLGEHLTDATNASRTMLMDLDSLAWDPAIASDMAIPTSLLPEIRSSAGQFGAIREPAALAGVRLAGVLGDQQAAMVGQACLQPGTVKNTYGTGNFMLMNTGTERRASQHGLLTTVCYRFGDEPPVYALEGSIAVSGALVHWVRDNLGLIRHAAEIEELAASVPDNGGAYLIPAFSGLFAPRWRDDARGVLVGLTRYVNKAHIARAALEATAFQSRELLDAMNADAGQELTEMKVDGGMTGNELLMQFQADILGIPVIRPVVAETTALGAASAAGLAVGFYSSPEEITRNWREGHRWEPRMGVDEREYRYATWNKAVERSLDWA